jgi:lysozyme family protein
MGGVTVDSIINHIIAVEGGYVDHPHDRGGPTMYGITERVAREHGYEGPMQDLPRDVAEAIYREQYYFKPGFDKVAEIHAGVAAEMTDTGVNMGQQHAVLFLQESLNVLNEPKADLKLYEELKEDGRLGPKTLRALRAYINHRGSDSMVLLKMLNCLQGARYVSLARSRVKNKSFVYGWIKHRVTL